nr:unnamed protein product [Callosobruchus chinensis]
MSQTTQTSSEIVTKSKYEMPKHNPSVAKEHFVPVRSQSSSVECKHCKKVLKTGGGTSNMLAHLRRAHPTLIFTDSSQHSQHQQEQTADDNNTKAVETGASEAENSTPQGATKKPKLLDFLESKKHGTSNSSPTAEAIVLMRHYCENPMLDIDANIFSYWKEIQLPHMHPLGTVAKKYLCVPATSVPSERVFSAAGYTISQRRNRLKNDAVDMLIFLKFNR